MSVTQPCSEENSRPGVYYAKRITYFGLGARFDGSGRRPKHAAWVLIDPNGKGGLRVDIGRTHTDAQARAKVQELCDRLNDHYGIRASAVIAWQKHMDHEAECEAAATALLNERARKAVHV